MRPLLAAVALTFAVSPDSLVAQSTPTESSIAATGRGEIRIKPTKAAISFTVQTRNASAAGAASENAALAAQTVRALRNAGLREGDITTSAYSVGPHFEFNSTGRRQDGFMATNVIRAEIENAVNVGKVIDAGLSGGATTVSSAQYSGDNMLQARLDALKHAVEESRREAEVIAAAAGGSLGRLISMVSSSAPGAQYGMDDYSVRASVALTTVSAPTALRPNEVTISATATGRWEFVPRR